MASSNMADLRPTSEILRSIGNEVVGRKRERELLVAALIAGRHILLEGPPGTGRARAPTPAAAALRQPGPGHRGRWVVSHHAGHAGASESGMNSHFRVRIASDKFEGLTRVQRHRLVYDSLQEFLDHGLHALAIEFR